MAARTLARQAVAVTLYDKETLPGGLMRFGYPSFRMPDSVTERDAAQLRELGVNIATNQELGRDFVLPDLQDRHDAVILATGAPRGRALGIAGEDLPGVYSALPFLYNARLGRARQLGQRVLVIGGGDTAIDCATTATWLGAPDVQVIYRGREDHLKALPHEVQFAEEKGVRFRFGTVLGQVTGDDGALQAQLRKGHQTVHESADAIVIAIGQEVDQAFYRQLGVTVQADGTTNHPRVWVAGGAAYGSDRLSRAIVHARQVATRVLETL